MKKSTTISKPATQVPTSQEILAAINSCVGSANYNNCLEQAAQRLVHSYSFPQIISATTKMQMSYPQTSCHDLMHFIATDEYLKNPDLPKIFNECNSSCFNACYHGAVIGYVDRNLAYSQPDSITKTISHVCDALENSPKKVQYGNCVHGIGHALMLVSDNDLPSSLKSCDILPNSLDQAGCYGGVFMENFPNSSSTDHPSRYIKADDPNYPCNILDKKYQYTCYTFLTTYFNYLTKNNLINTTKMCALIPQEFRNNCYQTIGTSGLGRTHDPKKLLEVCSNIEDYQGYLFCVRGLVMSYEDRYGGDDKNLLKMFDLCKQADSLAIQTCYQQIGISLDHWLPEKKNYYCSQLKDLQSKTWCENPNV